MRLAQDRLLWKCRLTNVDRHFLFRTCSRVVAVRAPMVCSRPGRIPRFLPPQPLKKHRTCFTWASETNILGGTVLVEFERRVCLPTTNASTAPDSTIRLVFRPLEPLLQVTACRYSPTSSFRNSQTHVPGSLSVLHATRILTVVHFPLVSCIAFHC